MSIHLLPPEVASQIAAGEVVERPASVVKELIENALDAGASFITITSEGAGQRLLEVSDNGSGIKAAELPLALERHATSKLTNAQDLFNIQTLGFRGEALASIASVSVLTLTSRTSESEQGARLRVEGGRVGALIPVGAPVGTVVRVENLFFNVPARLKFLKKESTEKKEIDHLAAQYALAYPQVRFHLKQEGRWSLQTSGDGDARQVLAELYGLEAGRQMLEVLADYDEIRVRGFISPLSLTRSNRRDIIFFVNRRPIQDSQLTTALVQAYQNMLMVGRFPFGAVFIELPVDTVDVNVHPTKAEVRFKEPRQLFTAIQSAARRALLAYTPVHPLEAPLGWTTGPSPSEPQLNWDLPEDRGSAPLSGGQEPVHTQTEIPNQSVPLLRLVGQLATTYLIAEGPDGLYLIDQHAAHERVLFERLMNERSQTIASQALLQPAAVEIPAAAARLLEEQMPVLNRLGFHVEPFGPGSSGPATYLVRALPALLAKMEPAAALRVLVEDFEEDETPLQAEIEAKIIARVCKRAAVKAGQVLSAEEQRSLLLDLENCTSPRTCPHGRPTMIHLSVDLLERQFGRKGAR